MLDSVCVEGVHVRQSSSESVVRFATFEVDLQQGELRKNGLKVRLQDQPFLVLAILLKRSGEVVTREELRDSVWPQDTFVDFDHALNTAVKKIRAALGDDADNPRFLETVPRRGYRFIAQMQREILPIGADEPLPVSELPASPTNPYRIFTIVGVFAVVLAVLGLAWKVVPRHRSDEYPPEFERLTFNLSDVDKARFTPDGASAVYSADTAPSERQLYTQRLNAQNSQLLGIAGAKLLSVSTDGELAVQRDGDLDRPMPLNRRPDILARVSLGGGAPRDLMTGIQAADWSPGGEIAVVRELNGKTRLEFPIGKVLYETNGWISSPRFSPRGDLIAFLDHPVRPDDRGSVSTVDLSGQKRTISSFWESEEGLAWSSNGDEVWFAATHSGVGRALYAVNLNGQQRRVFSVAGGLSLQDIYRDGRVLLTQDNQAVGIRFLGPAQKEPKDLSWHNFSIAAGITPDGKAILFGEEGENSGPSYLVALRPTDGSAPVVLGEGVAQALSPDGNWALSIMPPPAEQILLLPTGVGASRPLDRGTITHYEFMRAGWFEDGKHIFFVGSEAGHGPRCYVQDVDGGKPRAMTQEGIAFCTVAPNGKILAVTDDLRGLLYASNTRPAPEQEIRLNQGEIPVGWTKDSKFLYLTDSSRRRVLKYQFSTGQRQPWKDLPPIPNAEAKHEGLAITPDGQFIAYSYSERHTDLYLVKGLR
jgi:eukaryotic-like serine/threonine-protein kinase